MGVEIAEHEAAAVEEHQDRQSVLGFGPVHPDGNRSSRTFEAPVLHPADRLRLSR
jgi:hypothetical protein